MTSGRLLEIARSFFSDTKAWSLLVVPADGNLELKVVSKAFVYFGTLVAKPTEPERSVVDSVGLFYEDMIAVLLRGEASRRADLRASG